MNKLWTIFLGLLLMIGCQQAPEPKEVSGTLQLGHEVRAFRDNADNKEYWLIDKSGRLMTEYQKLLGTETVKYQPVQATLKVREITEPQEGFGADYDGTDELEDIVLLQALPN